MWKKGFIAGLINLVIGIGINAVLGVVFPGVSAEYQNTSLFRPWSDPLMMVFFAHPFILGVVLAYFWNIVQKQFTGDAVAKALSFAKLYFVIATIPGMFISYTSFQLSFLMVGVWTVTGFLQAFIAGLVCAKMK